MHKSGLLIIIITLAVLCRTAKAQHTIWKDHFSYRNCKHISESENYVVAAAELGVVTYNKNTSELNTISKANQLNDLEISAIKSLQNDAFIIGYNNGNIDIVQQNETINIPDLKLKPIQADKTINHFTVNQNKAYCSTGFAILVIDLAKQEISDTYYLGINSENLNISETIIIDDEIIAATDRGLLRADLNDPMIAYYEAWELISDTSTPYYAVNTFSNQIIAVEKQSFNYKVFYGNENAWNELSTLINFSSLYAFGDYLTIAQSNTIQRYKSDFSVDKTITEYTFQSQTVETILVNDAFFSVYENAFFAADQTYGLVKITNTLDESYLADGPYSNNCYQLLSTSNGVYSVAGKVSTSNQASYRSSEYSYFNNNEWASFKSSNLGDEENWHDLNAICSNKTNDNDVYFASFSDGVLNFDESLMHTHIGENTNGLQANNGNVRVGSMASDNEGNIWMSNAEVNAGIVVKANDEWHQFDYETTKNIAFSKNMLITKDNYVWLTVPNSGRQELMVINTNYNLLDDDEHEYRGPISPSSEPNEGRNKGQLKLWDENADVITNTVHSFAEDKNGYIWLGTDNGILVYYRPWSIFTESLPIVSRIKVPRNDGSNLADYLLEDEDVTCVAVDGANRKWLGTLNSGIYLVSDDGLNTFESFNTDNSPLPSNSITSVAISPTSGEVFIGTDNGIVSYKGKATEGDTTFDKIYAFPNPVRPEFTGDITITGLMENSQVKITTTSGKLVHETQSLGGRAYWNGRNFHGQKVKSGVYIVYVSADEGQQSAVTKVLIVR